MPSSRRIFAPEVVQTSNMDCGPASLKCLLEGFGASVSYGRLREACQTGVDGTSIDTLETVARQLGLDAEQILSPADHLLLPESGALPAIVVVKLPSGLTHFVVAWRRHGGVLQVMDPATGRRWPGAARFLEELYLHTVAAPEAAWLEYASGKEFQGALTRRLRMLGLERIEAQRLLRESKLAALDAAARMTEALIRSGGIGRGGEAARVLERFAKAPDTIPARYWFARPHTEDGEEQVLLRGAVLLRVRGRIPAASVNELPRELAAALNEQPAHPARELVRLLHAGGSLVPSILLVALALAAASVIIEAILFRGLFDLGRDLELAGQRLGAMAAIIFFSAALLCFDVPVFAGVLRLGRQVENRLRMAFLAKIPRLGDRYFQSRLTSDMAERSHTTQRLRHLPDLGRQLVGSVCALCATGAGIVWLDPAAAPLTLLAIAAAIVPPFAAQGVLAERDLRLRSHAAALTRYYLDAMLGLIAIRAHGAERSVRRQHSALLEKWAGAGFALQRAVVGLEAFQLAATFGLVAWLVLTGLSSGTGVGRVLLLVYWATSLPTLGQEIGALARQLPYYRNLTLRLLEPLGAPEEPESGGETSVACRHAPRIEFRGVEVQAGGNIILRGLNLTIESGSHLAILGPSGAGKSSLVGVLLGWLRPSAGEVLIDGQPLDCAALRPHTAWVDPGVQLWNRSLLENLCYGNEGGPAGIGPAIEAALLRNVLETLPEGLRTPLGEGGALLSGGEGQRVRLARGMLRRDVPLAILDEPFRGLDRPRRRELLSRAREHWKHATLLCVTHDIDETRTFDRVLVVENGRIVEDGDPNQLTAQRDSRYAAMLNAETDIRTGMWSGETWRRIKIESGRLVDEEIEGARSYTETHPA